MTLTNPQSSTGTSSIEQAVIYKICLSTSSPTSSYINITNPLAPCMKSAEQETVGQSKAEFKLDMSDCSNADKCELLDQTKY
jgi:hypothetical protein